MNNIVFLPITREWSADKVIKSIIDSDVPRRIMLYFDNVINYDLWIEPLQNAGFTVISYYGLCKAIPNNVLLRRPYHLEMRKKSQELTKDYDYVLYLEDDTIIPNNTWEVLYRHLDDNIKAASGIQIGRHGGKIYGSWKLVNGSWISYKPDIPTIVDAVGHYCLLTTGSVYSSAIIEPFFNEPIDRAHTRNIKNIIVDPSVSCGHLLESGDILW